MWIKVVSIFLIVVFLFGFAGCAAHHHEIGMGAKGNAKVEARQWYILFGLVPINEVNSQEMAAGATDYEIDTAATPLDIVITIFTSIVTVNSRTVTVTK